MGDGARSVLSAMSWVGRKSMHRMLKDMAKDLDCMGMFQCVSRKLKRTLGAQNRNPLQLCRTRIVIVLVVFFLAASSRVMMEPLRRPLRSRLKRPVLHPQEPRQSRRRQLMEPLRALTLRMFSFRPTPSESPLESLGLAAHLPWFCHAAVGGAPDADAIARHHVCTCS